jgi:hypothetical protein
VVKWAARHQEELRQNWIRAQQRAPLMRIPPLELSMYRDVVEVRPLNAYRLFVRFEDGNAGEIDITTLVPFDGVFAPLKDRQVFQSVRVNAEMGTIEWPSGADIDPVVLYCRVRGIPVPGEAQDTA